MKQWLRNNLRGTLLHRTIGCLKNRYAHSRRQPLDLNGAYDLQTVEVMKRILHRGSVAIDVGCHCGAILQHIVRLAPDGTHHAFEPLPHLAASLRSGFPRVSVHEAAVGDRVGSAEFLHVENDPGYSGLRRRNYDRPDPIISRIEVATTTIDEVISETQRVDFIKIDIEGGEYHALRGAMNTISRCRPFIVFEASCHSTGMYDVTPDDLFSLVTGSLDYELSTMARWLDGKPEFTFAEFEHNWMNGPDYYFIAAPRNHCLPMENALRWSRFVDGAVPDKRACFRNR